MRECKRCNRTLEEKSFVFKGKNKKRGNICNRCRYYSRNSEYKARRNGKKHGYSIDQKEYNNFLLIQNNRCAICKEEKDLVIDHCHKTGKVRGLLCNTCNVGLGMLKDSPDIIRAASQYLTNS